MPKITQVYEVSVEDPGDYIFTPSGIVIALENGQFQVYSENARHNFLRRTLMRHDWDKLLLDSVAEQGSAVRLRDVTKDLTKNMGFSTWSTEAVLETCYEMNPRQLFFLRRYSTSPSQTNMPPS